MHKKLLLFLTLIFLLQLHCGIFEPEDKNGSLNIQLLPKTNNSVLSKALETLHTVRCVVKKGSSEIHDRTHSPNSSGSFTIEIKDLEPADNYSVLLYGKNSSGDIIGRAYRSSISVSAGDESNVSMSWSDMRPTLSSPSDGSTITDNTPTFDWVSVSNASYYELEVDNSSYFSSPEINQTSLTSSGYTASSSLSDDTYYWRVRAKDSQGNWGGWSSSWDFTITSLYLNISTTSLSLSSSSNSQDSFTISSNTGWSVSDDATWLSVSPTSGSDGGTVTVTATSANTSTSSRSGTVTVSGTGVSSKTVNVTQAGGAETGIMTDQDGNVYQTVKIGNQWWMAENLKVTHYRNGDPIPNITSDSEWTGLSTGAYCVYDNNESYADTYGYLYNWYAVNDSRNIAPEGWHVPTDEEWKQLEMYLGMSQSEADDTGYRGTNEGSKLAGNASLWPYGSLENNAVFGTSGFSAFPGGYRDDDDGTFSDVGSNAYFWSATEGSTNTAWGRYLYYGISSIDRSNYNKPYGFSVRLVKD
ncbi:MAG: FISUMP domain-containing protein [bacterium]